MAVSVRGGRSGATKATHVKSASATWKRSIHAIEQHAATPAADVTDCGGISSESPTRAAQMTLQIAFRMFRTAPR